MSDDSLGQDLDQEPQKPQEPSLGEHIKNAESIGEAVAEGGANLATDLRAAKGLVQEAPQAAKTVSKGLLIGCLAQVLIFGFAILFFINIFNPDSAEGTTFEGGGVSSSNCPVTPANKTDWLCVYKYAESLMKIEWEFIAAITKQETGMGNNFGKCSYFAPAPSGGHVLTNGNGLRSAADKEAFQYVMEKLNKPLNSPVSCNPSGSNGGAMGYTQFMPREWKAGASALEAILGHYANPWDATDATVMAGRLLKGKVGISTDEAMPVDEALYRRAASKYYGDGNPNGKYANSVYATYLKFKRDQHL